MTTARKKHGETKKNMRGKRLQPHGNNQKGNVGSETQKGVAEAGSGGNNTTEQKTETARRKHGKTKRENGTSSSKRTTKTKKEMWGAKTKRGL